MAPWDPMGSHGIDWLSIMFPNKKNAISMGVQCTPFSDTHTHTIHFDRFGAGDKWVYPISIFTVLTVLVLGWLNLQIVFDNKIEIFIAAAAIIGGISMRLSPVGGAMAQLKFGMVCYWVSTFDMV